MATVTLYNDETTKTFPHGPLLIVAESESNPPTYQPVGVAPDLVSALGMCQADMATRQRLVETDQTPMVPFEYVLFMQDSNEMYQRVGHINALDLFATS